MIAGNRLGHEAEMDLLDDATEIDRAGSQQRIAAGNAQDAPRNR